MEALSKHHSTLYLDGLTSISDAAAEALAKHHGAKRGNLLGLNGLTSLSDYAAESLAKYEGKLKLDHDKLPPSASKILKDAGH